MADPIASPGTLVYGIQLPIQMLSEAIREPWERDATVEDLVTVTIAAEQAGCAFVAACDHVALPRNDYTARMSTTWYDPVATLAYLAARTSSVRLLTSVFIAAYRHPLHVAKSFLTLDHLSGGRAMLGIGAGHVEGEFTALGVDFAGRGRRTDETIDAVRAAFAHEHSSHHGEFFAYDDMGLSPRPVHGGIPIWIGGSSAPALRRVAERGDGWIPQGTPRAQMQQSVDAIRRHRDAVRPEAHIDLGFMPEYLYVGDPGWDTGGYTITGSAERLASSLRDAYTFGCNVLHLHFRSRDRAELCDQLAVFARDVAPLLAR